MSENKFILKAMCFFIHDGKLLVSKGFDKVKNEYYYRPLGGHIEFGENSETAIRREIEEELKSGIENLRFVEVVENIFTYQGVPSHEIVFIYTGELAKKDLYSQNPIKIIEPGHELDAHWVPQEEVLSKKIPLYPAFNFQTIFAPK